MMKALHVTGEVLEPGADEGMWEIAVNEVKVSAVPAAKQVLNCLESALPSY